MKLSCIGNNLGMVVLESKSGPLKVKISDWVVPNITCLGLAAHLLLPTTWARRRR